ncbi:MAG TPA: hypothetical protein PK402_00980 [Tepidisphaeraceae bacterium]|nr:hypothetical protein [Tepidisphaeraceae bacterium]
MAKRYQISDGKIVLTLQPDDDGWFTVTSPTDPAMITQARTIDEAFTLAKDAFAALADSRADKDRWAKSPKRRIRASA